jgi:diguanylate cyclase (GGDEF)-like protein
MKPAESILIFSGFAAAYGLTLRLSGNFDLGAWISAIAFCSFSALWSIKAYENRLLEFRNRKLLNRLQEKNRRLDALALQDTLTGLPNRRYFDRILDRCWTDPDLGGQSIALILLDIDHFKEYNDKNGHPAGDVCLQRVAKALSSVLRTDGTAIRIGGEEFAVILERATVDDALVAAKRLTEAVRKDGLVTASAGMTAAAPEKDAPENLYKNADCALYRAKNSGRDRIERG